jgi:hypothetical protein
MNNDYLWWRYQSSVLHGFSNLAHHIFIDQRLTQYL